MILVQMINDINKGLCSFVFLDEAYSVLLDISVRLYLNSYEKLGDSLVH